MILIEFPLEKFEQNLIRFSLKNNIDFHENQWIYLFPKNNDFLRFWKYRRNIEFCGKRIVFDKNNEIIYFDDKKQFENNIKKYYSVTKDIKIKSIIFEFPDEETAFYFKLKFC